MVVPVATLTHAPAAVLPLGPPQNSNLQNRKTRTQNAEKPPKQAVFLQNLVGVRGLEPRASCSQSRRATNCATPRYEIFQLWSNMGSTPVFDQLPAMGKTPFALASQRFPGFWGNAARTPASRSQSKRATDCATPGYGIVLSVVFHVVLVVF